MYKCTVQCRMWDDFEGIELVIHWLHHYMCQRFSLRASCIFVLDKMYPSMAIMMMVLSARHYPCQGARTTQGWFEERSGEMVLMIRPSNPLKSSLLNTLEIILDEILLARPGKPQVSLPQCMPGNIQAKDGSVCYWTETYDFLVTEFRFDCPAHLNSNTLEFGLRTRACDFF